MYKIEQGTDWSDGRDGPRLNEYNDLLGEMTVNQFFRIPLKINAKGKEVPERGFNVKAANELFAPKVFKKQKIKSVGKPGEDGYKPGYVKVQRVADAK